MQAVMQRQTIEDFLAAGNSLLNHQASSSEEIGRAGQEARRLVAQLGDVSQVRGQAGMDHGRSHRMCELVVECVVHHVKQLTCNG